MVKLKHGDCTLTKTSIILKLEGVCRLRLHASRFNCMQNSVTNKEVS